MQFIVKNLLYPLFLTLPLYVLAQTTYPEQGNKYQHWLSRMEIRMQRNATSNLLSPKSLSRQQVVQVASKADSVLKYFPHFFNEVDLYNMQSVYIQNGEWIVGDDRDLLRSNRTILGLFYKTKAHALEVQTKDFFLAVDPVLHMQYMKTADTLEGSSLFFNSRGLQFRGMIGKKIGFSTYLTDNQERGPDYFRDRVDSLNAVPGVGFYKIFKQTGVDYFDGRGSVSFNATKYLNFQFGYDKNFIGNGYRSLFLSDIGNSYLFLKMNTRIWKLNYTNILMELAPHTADINAGDKLLDKKYAALRHLSVNVRPWLQAGLFEAVVFGRKNHFDFTYLNPIMFLRVSEQQNGSADNALMGFDLKANIAGRAQLYGQVLLDEFNLKNIKSNNGWWANKFGVQAGFKWIDLLGVKNLDLQAELNVVRPFTYSHFDSVSNYSHFNQPLAHPLGANFTESIGILRYQPFKKWTLTLKTILWKQGFDSVGTASNMGSDIFKLNNTRSAGEYGYGLPSGPVYNGMNAQCHLSFELKENLFLEATGSYRKLQFPATFNSSRDLKMVSVGIRWNALRREYDY